MFSLTTESVFDSFIRFHLIPEYDPHGTRLIQFKSNENKMSRMKKKPNETHTLWQSQKSHQIHNLTNLLIWIPPDIHFLNCTHIFPSLFFLLLVSWSFTNVYIKKRQIYVMIPQKEKKNQNKSGRNYFAYTCFFSSILSLLASFLVACHFCSGGLVCTKRQ